MPIVNVYKEKELKNAYIGKVYEYSYDFRNKSVATLQADGWELSTTSISFDANGVYYYGSSMQTIGFPISLSDAKKIIITSSSTGSGVRDFSYGTGNAVNYSFGTAANGVYYCASGSSGFIGSTTTFNGGVSNSADFSIEIDLVNKTAKYVCTQFSINTTYNMSDADVTLIKQGTYLLGSFNSNVRLSEIYIKIEY